MDVVVDLQGVTLVRGGQSIISDLSLTTKPGEHWAIIGPNGAGKTSLLRVISGREQVTEGAACVFGSDVQDFAPEELSTRIGFASQSSTLRLPASSSAYDIVRTAAWGQSLRYHETYEDVDDSRAHDLMVLFGVEEVIDQAFSTLSEGERQRVSLARALMADPEILILDEPSAGLDLGARELLVSALIEVTADPHSPQLFLVTHQIEEIGPGFTHCAILKDGRLVAQGPINETLTSQNLTEAFEFPLLCGKHDGSWWARHASIQPDTP